MKLSDYQIEAVGRLLAATKPTPTFGLYDVPGALAGKTATTIQAHKSYGKFPVLITTPAHLVLQWRSQLISWGTDPQDISFTPRGMSLKKRLEVLEESDTPWTIVTYNMWALTNYWPYLLQNKWQAYSFDEAHRLRKGQQGKKGTWETIHWLRTKTRSTHMSTPLWLLSGTPIVKDPTDVFPLLNLASPKVYRSRDAFAQQYCFTSRGPYSLQIGKLRDPPAFHRLLGRYSLRRTWRQIPELSSLTRRDIDLPVELSKAELSRHRTIKRDYRDPVTNEPLLSSAAMIHALRRLTVAPKLEALNELVSDHPGRWLVLAWYRDTVIETAAKLSKVLSGSNVSVIMGDSSERQRSKAFESYEAGGTLVGTIGALAEGLNLQSGAQIAFVEQHYLSVSNEQAIGRVYRRGQSRPVLVYNLYAPQTFDTRVRKAALGRQTNIDLALNDFLSEEEWNE
jgi:SNF2 family DNA or RNA helicase